VLGWPRRGSFNLPSPSLGRSQRRRSLFLSHVPNADGEGGPRVGSASRRSSSPHQHRHQEGRPQLHPQVHLHRGSLPSPPLPPTSSRYPGSSLHVPAAVPLPAPGGRATARRQWHAPMPRGGSPGSRLELTSPEELARRRDGERQRQGSLRLVEASLCRGS
jgi:hypothetical protein